jgi:hypothetical protein
LREPKRTACLDDLVEDAVFDLERVQLGDRRRTLRFCLAIDLLKQSVELLTFS